MWVVYHKASRNIVGLTPDTDRDVDKDTAVNEIVGGLLEKGPVQEYDAILIQDREKAASYISAFPRKLVLTESEGVLRPVVREPETFRLHVKSDAPQRHPVDKIPMIAGDGTSYTTITLQKVDERSKLQRGPEHNDLFYLRTDHGTLRDAQGDQEINSVQLQDGRAALRLVSERIKRVANIQILSADGHLPNVTYRVEFF